MIVAVALLAALPKLWNFIAFLWRERTPALQWRLDYVYSCFIAVYRAAALRFAWEAVTAQMSGPFLLLIAVSSS